ncbi:MAG: hypothetical protein J6N81_02725 [Treponema sp.]|nr:hypothetical protein [Treponema sp.]
MRKLFVTIFCVFLIIDCFPQKNSDYERIPFEIQDGYILLPVNFSKKAKFNLVLDSTGQGGCLSRQGISKLSGEIGQNLYELLRNNYIQKNPNATSGQVEAEMTALKIGKKSLVRLNVFWCGNHSFYDEPFFALQNSILPGDGCITIDVFRNEKNIVVDCKNNVLEINAPTCQKDGIKLYKLDEGAINAYYVLGELDGIKQPFIIATASFAMIVRENIKDSTVYDYNDIKKMSLSGNSYTEYYTGQMAKIKICDFEQNYTVFRYNDVAIKHKDKEIFAASSFFNILGLPFFKDKCVQFDFENMMLYVW